jgi:nuclear cap-binding protein subunit 1
VRKQLLSIAESLLKPVEEEVHLLAKLVSDNYDDVETRTSYIDLTLQVVLEQPFKIPFVAAIVLVLNGMNRGEEAVALILTKAAEETERRVALGEWREVKLLLKFLGSLQGLLNEEGVWPILSELFERAVDLQTASSEDVSSHNTTDTWNWG